MIDNFMAAIMRGHLVVEGANDAGQMWRLDQDKLERVIDKVQNPEQRIAMQAFHKALLQTPVIKTDTRLGEMKLYINIDDSLPRKMNTIAMRKPLMKVRAYKNNSITAKYAAVLECSSQEGNRILRGMEPVRHDDWQEDRDKKNGKAVLRSIKAFILEELRKRVRRELGDEITIKGLNTLLPSELQIDGNPDRHGVRASNGPGNERESASLQGRETPPEPIANTGGKSVSISLTKQAVTDEDGIPASTGRQRGGQSKRGKHIAGIPTSGRSDEGSSTINGDNLSMRYWYDAKTGDYILVLRSKNGETEKGILRLAAALDGELKYMPHIEEATDISGTTPTPLNVEEGSIFNVKVTGKRPTRLRVHIRGSIRLQLGVK